MQVEGILKQVNKNVDTMMSSSGDIYLKPAKVQNVAEIIAKIQDTDLYDMKSAYTQLEARANEMLGNVSDQTIGEYANFTGKNPEEIRAGLNRMVRNENIQTPFVNITKAESAKINSLNGLYSSLVASKNKDAMDFLGWSPISNTTNAYSTNAVARASGSSYDNMDDINVLSKSKVTYGRYAGAEFQSLSLDELKEVMNINPTSFRNQAEIDNVTALKQRVNQYMEVLDKGSWSSKDQGLNVRVPGAEKSTKFKDVELESLLKENNIELKSIDDLLDSTKKDLNFNMARGTIGEEAEKARRPHPAAHVPRRHRLRHGRGAHHVRRDRREGVDLQGRGVRPAGAAGRRRRSFPGRGADGLTAVTRRTE
jgi:hypothetical protein